MFTVYGPMHSLIMTITKKQVIRSRPMCRLYLLLKL